VETRASRSRAREGYENIRLAVGQTSHRRSLPLASRGPSPSPLVSQASSARSRWVFMDRHSRIYRYRLYLRDAPARIVRPNNMPAATRGIRPPPATRRYPPSVLARIFTTLRAEKSRTDILFSLSSLLPPRRIRSGLPPPPRSLALFLYDRDATLRTDVTTDTQRERVAEQS